MLASLQDSPQWFLPLGIHTLCSPLPQLYCWSLWPIEYGGRDGISFPRLYYKRFHGFHLWCISPHSLFLHPSFPTSRSLSVSFSLSFHWISHSWGNQLFIESHVKLKPPDNSHLVEGDPSPQSSLQIAAPANCLTPWEQPNWAPLRFLNIRNSIK